MTTKFDPYGMNESEIGKAAIRALKRAAGPANMPENFAIYSLETIGTMKPSRFLGGHINAVKVIGATMRESLSGPRKGELCIPVKGTEIEIIVKRVGKRYV